jgi:hypothetical protein
MDVDRFDSLTRSIILAGARRRALGGLLLGSLGLLGWTSAKDVSAHDALPACKSKSGKQRKKCLKRARKHNAEHIGTQPPPDTFIPPDPCAGRGEGDSCGPDRACCSGKCIPLRSDPNHCGRCGYACSPTSNLTAICYNGGCACPGFSDCPGTCTCGGRYKGGGFCVAPDATCVGAKQCPNGDVDCDIGTVCSECNAGQPPVCIDACES